MTQGKLTRKDTDTYLKQVKQEHGWSADPKQEADPLASFDENGDGEMDLMEMIEFENDRQKIKSLLAVGICWIGFHLTPSADMAVIKENKLVATHTGEDGSEFYPHYELTSKGEPICINEYATKIASQGPNTHVIHLDDY